jgi:hypothetical protein
MKRNICNQNITSMKDNKFITGFKRILFVLSIVIIVQSCEKGNTENSNCLAIVVPDILRLNVVNKNTGEDLFFSPSPVYTTNQIHFVIDDMQANVSPKIEASATLGKHFSIEIGGGSKAGYIRAYLADKLAYTIQYTMKEVRTSNCPKYVLDKVIVDGNQVEENINSRVILLKQ